MNVQKFADDEVIDTTIGPMRVGDMEKRLSDWDTDWECGCAREFWFDGELVRRDVSVQLKVSPGAEAKVGGFFGRLKRLFNRSVQ